MQPDLIGRRRQASRLAGATCLVTCGISLALCSLALAADPDTNPNGAPPRSSTPNFEIAAFGGYRMGGTLALSDTGQSADLANHGSFGLALDLRADDVSWYELFYGRQSTAISSGAALAPTSIRVDYLQVGGTLALNDELPVKPYILGGLGATRFAPDPVQGHEDTRFSVSLGAGLRVPLGAHFSFRLETRGFLTLLNSDTAFLCRSDQTGALCQVRSHGSSFIQFDVLAGAAYAF